MRAVRVFATLTVAMLGAASALSQKQGAGYAFLVACARYDPAELKPLRYAKDDITAFADVLRAGGFAEGNVVLLHDDQKGRDYPLAGHVRDELRRLLDGLGAEDTVIIAFNGHGVQYADDAVNYFCPLDARLADRTTLVSLREVYDRLDACKAARKLLLVDACLNDPQSDLGKLKDSVGLAAVSRPQAEKTPKGTVALFSCAEG